MHRQAAAVARAAYSLLLSSSLRRHLLHSKISILVFLKVLPAPAKVRALPRVARIGRTVVSTSGIGHA